ncbi:MAG TPA: penicillin-binding transpeptidase domain-containing protein [Anaerolineales bacterium]|nr:penicillin-binding transpeptidase domain-containing protein [Anaerolineales bacterium]
MKKAPFQSLPGTRQGGVAIFIYLTRKMRTAFWMVLILSFALISCGRSPQETVTPTASPTATLGPVEVITTSVPEARPAARRYLDAWQADDYPAMYALLTSISKDALEEEDFIQHYRGIATEMALSGLDYEILSELVRNPQSAQVGYRVTFHSSLVGDIQRDTVMNLTLEQGSWHVQWDDTLVMPELVGGNYLGMERYVPSRGNIYDRNGRALVAISDATAIGLVPDQIDPEQEESLFTWLVRLTGLSDEQIRQRYESFPPGADWYLSLGVVPAEEVAKNINVLSGFSGLQLTSYKARYYFDGGIAPHVVGYVTAIQAEEEEEYLRRGYRRDERVGQAGLEGWGEDYLSGVRGGALYVFNNQGQIVTRLAARDAQPSQAIYTTLERDFQQQVQRSLSGFRGAVVVLERDTGRVLAMASSPGFDPNAFEPQNRNFSYMLDEIFSDPETPTFNRTAQGQYPLGSVFKIITMAAGLETGKYTPETTYQCGYFFTELVGITLNDWTYDHYLQGDETPPSGLLTLPEGLMRSCNPFFWHIGLDLYNQDLTTAISDMARGFGLGALTGIESIEEQAGNIPDPVSQVDATNLAIGQGETLVTPLQVADFVAAIGNGGTLYRPQVIEQIAPPDAEPTFTFEPEERGKLPISPENLAVIQEAMLSVVANRRGTAWHRFTGLDIPVAGKTGTAQSGFGDPHAWFAGYTFAERADKPDIAVAVVVENIGEGSDYAAPIFRRVVELYYFGSPLRLYPWESGFYVTRTPTPEGGEETPQP